VMLILFPSSVPFRWRICVSQTVIQADYGGISRGPLDNRGEKSASGEKQMLRTCCILILQLAKEGTSIVN
jgi:hypothetical protein